MIDKFNTSWLSVTYNCNSKCKWCYASSNNYELMKGKSLQPHRQDDVVNLLHELGIKKTILIGGEPSVYSGIEDLTRKLTSKGLKPGMVSNGRRFKDIEFTQRMKDSGLEGVTFSIEGHNSFLHDFTSQCPGSYDDAMKGLENVQKVGLNYSTNTVMSLINWKRLEETVESLHAKGVQHMGFNILGPCFSNKESSPYYLTPTEAVRVFQKAYKKGKELGVKVKLVTPAPFCLFDKDLLPELKQNHAIGGTPCQVVHGNNFVMDYNGDIVPCTHLTGYPLFNTFKEPKGIMNREEFIKEYNSGRSNLFRESMGRYATVKCNTCTEPCSGGCPLMWAKFSPNTEIEKEESWFCDWSHLDNE